MHLLDLPNEILSRITSFHDTPSPFDAALLEKPKSSFLSFRSDADADADGDNDDDINQTTPTPAVSTISSSKHHHPLKQMSLTSRFLRSLTLPILFTQAVLNPLQLDGFLVFLANHDLTTRVASVVAHVQAHYTHLHPAWWARLLNEVPTTTRISVIAPPEVFAALTGVLCSWSTDAWAFDMPFQILRLEQQPQSPASASASASSAVAGKLNENKKTKIDYDDLPNFLLARPWTSMLVNEGSSLMAYTTYEFFLRRTPSLLTALHFNNSAAANGLFANLLSFDFVAIFPFYNHVDEILKCVRAMRRLRRLFVKLCPEPESTVFHDEVEAVGGHMDVHDPWNECETSWMLIAHTVVFLTLDGQLSHLCMDDVKVPGVRDSLERTLTSRLQEWWDYQDHGSGVWRRRISQPQGPEC